ncbi:MAG: hypothetical protein LBN39_09240 [Planctomycetaceae bacterium]|jgi:hypothetical protein|nr:hypothetical protein [Planctomycetaceae bacterium]
MRRFRFFIAVFFAAGLFGVLLSAAVRTNAAAGQLFSGKQKDPQQSVLLTADSLPAGLCGSGQNQRNTSSFLTGAVAVVRSFGSARLFCGEWKRSVSLYFHYGNLRPHLFLRHLRN